MGQRLVLQLRDADHSLLATLYYHWSAYTTSALYEIQKLLGEAPDDFVNLPKVDKVKYIIDRASGLTSDDVDYVKETFGFEPKVCTDRNMGIVAISPDKQDNLLDWSEGTVEINLADMTFDLMGLVWSRYEDDFEDDEEIDTSELEVFPYDLSELHIDNIDEYGNFLGANESGFMWQNEIYTCIY